MPFRETELDWMTKCETSATGDGLAIRTKRAMPEIGNEDAISSCGGAEWGEHVAFVEDEPLYVACGARTKTRRSCRTGASPRASRALRTEAGAVDAAHHCLAHPDDPENARVRGWCTGCAE
jgi:hypothetical protein